MSVACAAQGFLRQGEGFLRQGEGFWRQRVGIVETGRGTHLRNWTVDFPTWPSGRAVQEPSKGILLHHNVVFHLLTEALLRVPSHGG